MKRFEHAGDVAPRTAALVMAALIVVPLVGRLLVAGVVELAPDEAYYLAWSRRLDWCYLDHPPLVAYLIAGSTALFGESTLAVRLPAVLGGAALTWLLFASARVLGASRRSSLVVTAMATGTLLFGAVALVQTPDAPLALSWGVTVYFLANALVAPRSRALWAAVPAMAAGFLAKLTMGLLWAWSWLSPGLPRWRSRLPFWSIALAGLVPLVWWNAVSDWPMFAFHGARVAGRSLFSVGSLGEFLGGQVALLCVVPAILIGVGWARGLRKGAPIGLRMTTTLSLGPVLCVAVLSLFTKVEANWIGPAYLPAFAGLAIWLDRSARWRRWCWVAVGFSFVVSVIAHVHLVHPFLPLSPRRDPSSRMRGWQALAQAVAAQRRGRPVRTSRYQEAAVLAHLLGPNGVSTFPKAVRLSQYDFWRGPAPAGEAICVWLEGQGPARGRLLRTAGRSYRITPCDPHLWRNGPKGRDRP